MDEKQQVAEKLIDQAAEQAKSLVAGAITIEEKQHKERLDEMIKKLDETIQQKVNGKIDNLTKIVEAQGEENKVVVESLYTANRVQVKATKDLKFTLEEYIKSDMAWKETASPAVTLVNNTTFWGSWVGKKIKQIALFIVSTGAVLAAIKAIENYFK